MTDDLESQLAIQDAIADWLDSLGVDSVTVANAEDEEGLTVHLTWEDAFKLAEHLRKEKK